MKLSPWYLAASIPVALLAGFAPEVQPTLSGAIMLDAQWRKAQGANPTLRLKADTTPLGYKLEDFKLAKAIGKKEGYEKAAEHCISQLFEQGAKEILAKY